MHANKKGVRYRYASRDLVEARKKDAYGWRLPAYQVDTVVVQRLVQLLHDRVLLADWVRASHPAANLEAAVDQGRLLIATLKEDEMGARRELVRKLIRRVILKLGSLTIEIDASAIVAQLLPQQVRSTFIQSDRTLSIDCPILLKRRGVEIRMVLTNGTIQGREPDDGLVQLILRAHRYLARLVDGQGRTITDVAEMESLDASEVSRILPLAFLSPSVVDSVLSGTQPVNLTRQRLSRLPDLPGSWQQQAELFARE